MTDTGVTVGPVASDRLHPVENRCLRIREFCVQAGQRPRRPREGCRDVGVEKRLRRAGRAVCGRSDGCLERDRIERDSVPGSFQRCVHGTCAPTGGACAEGGAGADASEWECDLQREWVSGATGRAEECWERRRGGHDQSCEGRVGRCCGGDWSRQLVDGRLAIWELGRDWNLGPQGEREGVWPGRRIPGRDMGLRDGGDAHGHVGLVTAHGK